MAPRVPPPPIITLLTDFGLRDAYVGIMKGVILGFNPHARLVDLGHEIPPQDILAGALALKFAWRYFPPGTVHLAVVDPGVGSSRRGLAASILGHFFVGPDNGLFSLIFQEQEPGAVVSLENFHYFLPQVSATFHGRDIFAPVAAHLSLRTPLTDLGPELADPVKLDIPSPRFQDTEVFGQVIYCDHFGNLISNIPFASFNSWLQDRSVQIQVDGCPVTHLGITYSDAPPGALLALAGSHGYLEIASRQGSAAQILGAGPGASVQICLNPTFER